MSTKVSVTKSKLDALANAVSVKSGEAIPLTIDEMTAAVNSINSSGVITLEDKSVTPSETAQVIQADEGYDGLGTVNVGAISSTYVGSSVPRRTDADMSVSGANVTAPRGYYETAQTASVLTMTLPSGTTDASGVLGQEIAEITQPVGGSPRYLSISPGYNSQAGHYTLRALVPQALPSTVSGSSTGTQKAVIPWDTTNSYLNIPAGYLDTAQYYTLSGVPAGSATAPASISSSSATVSTGANTLTLSKTISVTPSVTAGYVGAGTAGNSSVSLTASVITKGTATITPTTADQTIGIGTYITGKQTILGDANLVAGNIKSGVPIFGVTGSYTGGGSATVKSATASTSSNATSISFTGVSASPKMFVCMLDAQSSLGSTRYVIAVDYDGTTTRGTYGYSSSNTRYAYYSNSYFTWSYSGTTLTINTNSSTNGGYFRSGYSYRLIYAY